MEEKDLCDFCGGELEAGKIVDVEIWRDGELLVCKDIPADVCSQCGERYFSAEVSAKIDKFLERYRQEKPFMYMPVPVFSADLVLA